MASAGNEKPKICLAPAEDLKRIIHTFNLYSDITGMVVDSKNQRLIVRCHSKEAPLRTMDLR